MKYFFLFLFALAIIPAAHALGLGVVPDNLEFTEIGQSKSLTIHNPNDFPISFAVRGPYFDYDITEGKIDPGEKRVVAATLAEDVSSQTSVIMVETRPLSDRYKSIGMLPTIGIKAKISLGEEDVSDDFVDERPLFTSAEIIVIVMLAFAVIVMGSLPLIRKKKGLRKIKFGL